MVAPQLLHSGRRRAGEVAQLCRADEPERAALALLVVEHERSGEPDLCEGWLQLQPFCGGPRPLLRLRARVLGPREDGAEGAEGTAAAAADGDKPAGDGDKQTADGAKSDKKDGDEKKPADKKK